MSGFGKKSTAYICYLIVNFWWYLSCLTGLLFPAMLTYGYFAKPDNIMGINVPLADSMVTLKNPEQYQYVGVGSVSGQVDFSYLLQHSPGTYIVWAVFVCSADIRIGLPMVGDEGTFIIMGLLVFTLAAIFEKGNEMYQELKLTV